MKPHKILKHTFIPFEGNSHTPHFFRGITISIILGISILLLGISIGNSYFLNNTIIGTSLTVDNLIDGTNELRIAHGSLPLIRSQALNYAAELKAKDMVEHGYFAHMSPEGKTPWHWLEQAGYVFTYAGENLAVNFRNPHDVGQAWFNSPEHRDNLLNDTFQEIGMAAIGGVHNNLPVIFIVEMFGSPGLNYSNPITHNSSSTNKELTTLLQNELLLLVKNENNISRPIVIDDTPKEVLWYNSMIINITQYIEIFYKILLTVTIMALFLLVFVEIKKQHAKHTLYGILLLISISLLLYLNRILTI